MKNILKSNYFKAFAISFLIGCLIIIPYLIINKGILMITSDLNFQQIPFNMLMNNTIKEGSGLWTWFNDLGSSFIGTFTFYNIGSPFVWLGFLFPAKWFPYLIGPIMILKYAVAGLTSYAFLQRYVKNKKYAILGSILYAFTGFQITNMLFNHFHDVVAFFPLLLLTLDRLVYDNKKGWFGVVVALCAMTNYYFFIGQVVFVILYFVVKVLTKEYKITVKKFLQIVIEALLGVGIAAFLLLPSITFVLGNPRLEGSWTLKDMFVHFGGRYPEILRGMISPSEVMSYRSVGFAESYKSIELFLPLIGGIYYISYFIKNRKNWVSVLGIFCLIAMFIPVLNSLFSALNIVYYARWFYMPLLIFSLASVMAMEKKLSVKSGFIITFVIAILLIVGMLIYRLLGNQVIFDKLYFTISMILFVLCLVIVLFVSYLLKDEKRKITVLFIGTIIYIIIIGNLFFFQNNRYFAGKRYREYFINAEKFISLKPEDYERIDVGRKCYDNLGYVLSLPITKGFNTNASPSAFEFYKSIGRYRNVFTKYNTQDPDLRNFLGVKYFISCEEEPGNDYYDEEYELIETNGIYRIYKNEKAYAINKRYKYYLDNETFMSMKRGDRKILLNQAVILEKNKIKEFSDYLEPLSNECLSDLSLCYIEHEESNLKKNKSTFTDKYVSTEKEVVLYAIPYDKGWKAWVNGEETEIFKVDNGMMSIKLEPGNNNIEFKYEPEYFKVGVIISVISVLGLAGYMLVPRRKEEK